MCHALRELMKDEIQEEIQTAEQKAAQKATDATTIANIKKSNAIIKYGCKGSDGNIENLRSRSAQIHGDALKIILIRLMNFGKP